MILSLPSSLTDLGTLLDVLPSLPDVPGWLGIYGGRAASIHLPAGTPTEDYQQVIDALEAEQPGGRRLDPGDAGYNAALEQWDAGVVAGWRLSVVTRVQP